MGTVDAATALQLLRAKQNAYYIQAVQDALLAEEQRKQKLHKVTNKKEAKRLEKQFVRERSADRERLHHIQEDHALLLNAKIAEWKAAGGVAILAPDEVVIKLRTARTETKGKQKSKFTKESLNRLAVPRTTTARTEEPDDYPTSNAETSQGLEFYKKVYRKEDRARLSRNAPPPPTLSAANLRTVRTIIAIVSSSSQNNENTISLSKMSETELLRTKANLLTELHGVVSMEARIIHDDQCTVRSSVSSWKSHD
ncbi:hypothetical protein PHMEG_0005442 [Phytophthora megakarya]|uniref:Uncharacterized protein n=1 Tax=Phytophthora megakarya TaxID=4795 RepID=A0A225WTA0_9STRA|nr:hypothetical protein PHMEG_0005442 [Phytophthora megakarya]